MRALVFDSGRAAVRDVRRPAPRAGFALVRVLLSGICNTDLELKRGYHGFSGIPGHEFVGVVEGPAVLPAPRPPRRRRDQPRLRPLRLVRARASARHCPKRTVLGIRGHPGAHAEFLTLPEANLREVPDAVADEEAVFVEPLAAACEILDQVRGLRGDARRGPRPRQARPPRRARSSGRRRRRRPPRAEDPGEGGVLRPRRRGHGLARRDAARSLARAAARDDRLEVDASRAGALRRGASRRERGHRRRARAAAASSRRSSSFACRRVDVRPLLSVGIPSRRPRPAPCARRLAPASSRSS